MLSLTLPQEHVDEVEVTIIQVRGTPEAVASTIARALSGTYFIARNGIVERTLEAAKTATGD